MYVICKIVRRIFFANKLLMMMIFIKGRDVRGYYYIEIVKCYLCLALNHHQNGVSM
jgi:hypothetical protein